MSLAEAAAYESQVAGLVQKLNPGINLPEDPGACGEPTCASYLLRAGCLGGRHGEAVPKDTCAMRNADFFSDSRRQQAGSGGPGSPGGSGPSDGQSSGTGGGAGGQGGTSTKWEPLGELISINLELSGLMGQPVFLSWSIFQESGPNHLSSKWLGNFIAYRLLAATDDDTGTLEMWIPLPRQQGPYFVHLTMMTDHAGLASMNSGPFG